MSNDARLLELEFLNRLSRSESTNITLDGNIPQRDMIVHLLIEALVNDVAGIEPWGHSLSIQANLIMQEATDKRCHDLVNFLSGKKIALRISHRGRVRLAELEQALKTGREREPFGILLGARYWERDLRIALLSASSNTPIALCFLDMNGLKAINDSLGHGAGNEAIRTFLQVVSANVEGVGDAYRYGGDEVVAILPNTDADAAGKLMAILLKQLGEEQIEGAKQLTASCGIGVAIDPELVPKEFINAVDAVQYEAKATSKEGPERRSVLAIEGRNVQVL